MVDLRQELAEQHRHGPDTYVGDLCLRASEEIRRLENRLHHYKAMVAGVRASISVESREESDG